MLLGGVAAAPPLLTTVTSPTEGLHLFSAGCSTVATDRCWSKPVARQQRPPVAAPGTDPGSSARVCRPLAAAAPHHVDPTWDHQRPQIPLFHPQLLMKNRRFVFSILQPFPLGQREKVRHRLAASRRCRRQEAFDAERPKQTVAGTCVGGGARPACARACYVTCRG